jgi:hypothetical protein
VVIEIPQLGKTKSASGIFNNWVSSINPLQEGCTAYCDYITLTPIYTMKSVEMLVNSFTTLLKSFTTLNVTIWQPFHSAISNFSSIKLPEKLESIKQISMDKLIEETQLPLYGSFWLTKNLVYIYNTQIPTLLIILLLTLRTPKFPNLERQNLHQVYLIIGFPQSIYP